jgi:N6-L-threonylcarbamoyladenine synthase
MPDACILGIETSCDETAAAVVRAGEQVLSNVVSSQIATHQPYGGVVPELASREHLRAIVPVVRQALSESRQSYTSIDALAVTRGPGLAGALLVGISYAKALAYALEKPLITVNHLEGHIHAVLLEERQKVVPFGGRERGASRTGAHRRNPDPELVEGEGALRLEFPVLALVVSSGHTHLFLAEEHQRSWKYRNIGRTRDDAAGEAYDKVAKLLGLGYPGGPMIDTLAQHGNPRSVKFGSAQIKHRNRGIPREHQTAFDFSFSGLKTAVLRYIQAEGMQSSVEARRQALAKLAEPKAADLLALCDRKTLDLIASFQRAVVDDLVSKTLTAAGECGARTLFVTGGVAANQELRRRFEIESPKQGLPVYFPSRQLSTDNAAMIAAAAYPKFLAGDFATADFSAEASLAL